MFHIAVAVDRCTVSDKNLFTLRAKICNSLVQEDTNWCGTYWRNATASKDWPSQAVYIHEMIDALSSPTTCLNTTFAHDTVAWLDTYQADPGVSGSIMWTWLVFQVQYYDMPRKPGCRIESPDTLGRKCWAVAYLTQLWKPKPLLEALTKAGLSLSNFTSAYERAIPLTMDLCEEVMANCFVNATYDPTLRNGTCPNKIDLFRYLGFERENLKRLNVINYPFY